MTVTMNAVINPNSPLLESATVERTLSARKSVYDLTGAEVADLRRAFAELMAISDNRGYQYVAGVHGLPQYFCPHGTPMFLVWHRPFLLMFEQALQARVPGVALPYWDWTTDRAQQEGLPAIFTARTYTDATGAVVPNPLYASPIVAKNQWFQETQRDPGPPGALGQLAQMVRDARGDGDYDTFSADIEQPHNGLHGWVGGAMGMVPTSAYDPIFWVHHCFIEKLFCDWQDANGYPISATISGQVLPPFNTTADKVWDYTQLGYHYVPEAAPAAPQMAIAAPVEPPSHVATFDLKNVPDDPREAELQLLEVQHPLESFEVRVFFNVAPAAATPRVGNDAYAGSLFTFGHGGCTGDPGHCDVPKVPEDVQKFAAIRPRHHLTPMRFRLDVTRALKAAKQAKAASLSVHMLAVKKDGTSHGEPGIQFDILRLRVT